MQFHEMEKDTSIDMFDGKRKLISSFRGKILELNEAVQGEYNF